MKARERRIDCMMVSCSREGIEIRYRYGYRESLRIGGGGGILVWSWVLFAPPSRER